MRCVRGPLLFAFTLVVPLAARAETGRGTAQETQASPPDTGVDAVSGAGVPAEEPQAPLAPFVDAFAREGPARKPALTWTHTRFRDSEYVAIGAMVLLTVPGLAIQPSKGRFPVGVGFDESARDTLRISDWEERQTARDASDVLLTAALNYPLIVDAAVVASWYRDAPDVGWEMAMIDLEAFVANAALATWVSALSSRERPYGRNCPAERELQDQDCASNNRYRSYFSGHTSTAFVSAGLICSHHMNLPLYGGGTPDGAACGLALGAAGTMAYLRVAADQHYLSDVLTGAAVGSLVGFGLPWALHYRAPARDLSAETRIRFIPAPNGAHVVGSF